MENWTIKVKQSDIPAYLFLICTTVFYTLRGTAVTIGNLNYLIYVALLLGAINIVRVLGGDIRTNLLLAGVGIIIIMLFRHNGDTRMVVAFLSMLSVLKVDNDKIIGVLLYTKCFAILFAIVFLNGYHHINGFALHGGVIVLLLICREERKNQAYLFKKIIAVTLFLGISLYTRTGSAFVCLGVAVLLFLIREHKIGKKILSSRWMFYIFPLALVFNYFFALGVGESMMPFVGKWLPHSVNQFYLNLVRMFDRVTSSRLTLVKYSLAKFGVSWLGGNVDYGTLNLQADQYFNLDSGFIWLIQGWGLLMTILLMVLCVILMRYFISMKLYNFVIAAVGISLWAINEDMLVSVGTNFLLMFIGKAVRHMFYERKRRIMNENT